eukprot:CAMPEP_0197516242 /NCGR_PEP_ID=MMETSP1318-20131121/1071_1 /TAXON_ID=552666 /ORGANISM="Partenskyella glossopodia, Strain RCC365" /LENGTH=123 /DNA_ID=CAMNT_0043064785 /DNA_START=230 /DNA_END=601 /DNA_ORIENTATION=-
MTMRMPTMARTAMRMPMRSRAAITNYETFEKEMNEKYPDEWEMKGDALYADLKKQFEEKTKFIENEEKAMESKIVNVEDFEEQAWEYDRGIGGILAPLLLAGLPLATIAGLATGVITTVAGAE